MLFRLKRPRMRLEVKDLLKVRVRESSDHIFPALVIQDDETGEGDANEPLWSAHVLSTERYLEERRVDQ